MSGHGRLRIGFGSTLLERSLNGGKLDGIGIYAANLLSELNRSGVATALPACFPPKPWEARLTGRLPGRIAFRRAYGISAALSGITSLPFAGSAAIGRQIDVFHAPDHLIPRMKGVPVVATICDAISVKRPDWMNAGPLQFRSRLAKAAAAWAQHVIAISAAMVPELMRHFGIPEQRISVVHMGIAEDWLAPVAEPARRQVLARYGLQPGYFLFVGTLQPRKNVEGILAAYEAMPEELRRAHGLVIAGQAGWASEALVRRLGSMHAHGCRWLQYVPAEHLKALYQGAAAFVFPSFAEGFGMPVLEAFASGVPVITANASSLPEVAGDAALLVDPHSAAELRDAMVRLVENRALADSLVRKGRARAALMSWKRCVAKTCEIYRKVL